MTNTATETRAVVVEREMPHPPEKLWRALTQPHLIEEWLMKNDFAPVVGHRFNLRGDWGGVLDCEVLAIEPNRALSYTWNFKHADAAFDLQSVVTFTLTPTRNGHAAAHGADGFSAGPEAGFWRRQGRMAAVLWEAGGGFGTGGLKSAASRFRAFQIKGGLMNWNMSIRQIHRWLSIAFTPTVIANFVAMGLGEPPALVVYSPLPPLFLLLFTGLYLFVLPYAAKLRGERGAAG